MMVLPRSDDNDRRCGALEEAAAAGLKATELQREMGLSEAQARCLIALREVATRDGGEATGATAAEVAALARVKRTTAAMALARLGERGLAQESCDARPARWRAARDDGGRREG